MKRCRYVWRASRGFVRCTHLAYPDHGPRHENSHSYVAVGYESQMEHYWVDERGE